MIVDDTSLGNVAPTHASCANRQVETEQVVSPVVKYAGQGAPALQQHVRSPPAPSERHALHTPNTGATQLSGSTLQQHVRSPTHSGWRSERAPLTSRLTQPITTQF
jgi:hypothetical protein